MSKPTEASRKTTVRRKRGNLHSARRTTIVRNTIRKRKIRSRGVSIAQLDRQVRQGFSYSEFEDLQSSLKLPAERLAEQVGLSRATLQRRKKSEGNLNAIQSDRVVRLARLLGKAVDVFEDEDIARRWMLSPQRGLGGEMPLDFAFTEVGAREVENLLGRIEQGVFT